MPLKMLEGKAIEMMPTQSPGQSESGNSKALLLSKINTTTSVNQRVRNMPNEGEQLLSDDGDVDSKTSFFKNKFEMHKNRRIATSLRRSEHQNTNVKYKKNPVVSNSECGDMIDRAKSSTNVFQNAQKP